LLLGLAPELRARIEGQLSDLEVEIEVADELESKRVARWSVWTEDRYDAETSGRYVCIRSDSGAPVYCRRFAAPRVEAETSDSSASYELAALSVRSAVRADLLEQGSNSTSTQPKPAPVVVPRPEPREPAKSQVPNAEPAQFLLRAGVNAGWHFDGQVPAGSGVLGADLGVLLSPFRLGLAGSVGSEQDVTLQQVGVQSRRISAGVELGVIAARFGDFSLEPSLRLAALWTLRQSAAASSAAQVTAPRTAFGPLFGLRLPLEYAVHERVSFGLVPGVEWLPVPTDWVVLGAGEQEVAVRRTWHLQPSLSVAVHAQLW
jgi:hypothetical protein